MQNGAIDFFAAGGIPMALLILASCILVLVFLDSLVKCFPSMLATTLRWKESENLNYSAKLSRYRSQSCIALTLPFLLVCSRYGLFSPAVNSSALIQFALTCAAWAAYLLARLLLNFIFKNRAMRQQSWACAVKCPQSFFCIATVIMLASDACLSFCGCADNVIKTVLLWEIGVIYLLCIVRKTQIFSHYRGVFSGILYLCTLEIIPSGLLIAADILL